MDASHAETSSSSVDPHLGLKPTHISISFGTKVLPTYYADAIRWWWWGVLRTRVHHILILVVTYQTLTVPSITLWNHDSLLFTHSTCSFLSVCFGFYCLIVTKNSTDCMKVTHMYYLFLFLYLHLQLGMKECLCRTSCRLQHLCYLFLFIPTLQAWRTTKLQLIYI